MGIRQTLVDSNRLGLGAAVFMFGIGAVAIAYQLASMGPARPAAPQAPLPPPSMKGGRFSPKVRSGYRRSIMAASPQFEHMSTIAPASSSSRTSSTSPMRRRGC